MIRSSVPVSLVLMILTISSCSLFEVKTETFSTNTIDKPAAIYRGEATIAFAWGDRFSPPQSLTSALTNLKEALIKYSEINTTVNQNLRLGTDELFDTSFVIVATDRSYDLSPTERENVRQYLMNGGFILMDNVQPVQENSQSEASMRKMMRDALGSQARFEKIPNSHEIYHNVFEFDVPPRGAEVGVAIQSPASAEIPVQIRSEEVNYLEGIWIGNRLVALLSNKGYLLKWNEYDHNEPQLKFGVNLVVYALTSGGIGSVDRQ